MLKHLLESGRALIVPKAKIAASRDYNLSGERYRDNGVTLTAFPFRSIKDIAVDLRAGFASGKSSVDTVGVPHVRPMNIDEDGQFVVVGMKSISEDEYAGREEYSLEPGDVLFNNTNSIELVGKTCLIEVPIRGGFSNHMTRIRVNRDVCVPRFLSLLLHSAWRKGQFTERATRWVGQAGINTKSLGEFEIPLPPLDVQREIVAEIEGYQRVIDGARAVVAAYRPHIVVDPSWPMVRLESIADVQGGVQKTPSRQPKENHRPYLTVRNVQRGFLDLAQVERFEVSPAELERLRLKPGDILVVEGNGSRDQIGRTALFDITDEEWVHQNHVIRVRLNLQQAVPSFIEVFLNSDHGREQMLNKAVTTSGLYMLSAGRVCSLEVPLPPLATQQAIVAEIEAEQALVNANRELIQRFEGKIAAALARVWGETGQ